MRSRAVRGFWLALLVAGAAASPSPAQGPLPDGETCVTAGRLTEPGQESLGCVFLEDEEGEYPDGRVCVTDGALAVVFWWYDGVGTLACGWTHEWKYLGTPGACMRTGASEEPVACLGKDEMHDSDGDGQVDDPVHCVVWVAGSSFCFQE